MELASLYRLIFIVTLTSYINKSYAQKNCESENIVNYVYSKAYGKDNKIVACGDLDSLKTMDDLFNINSILRKAGDEHFFLLKKRDDPNFKSLSFEVKTFLDITYVKIPHFNFSENSFLDLLSKLEGKKNIVIDVRQNKGGILSLQSRLVSNLLNHDYISGMIFQNYKSVVSSYNFNGFKKTRVVDLESLKLMFSSGIGYFASNPDDQITPFIDKSISVVYDKNCLSACSLFVLNLAYNGVPVYSSEGKLIAPKTLYVETIDLPKSDYRLRFPLATVTYKDLSFLKNKSLESHMLKSHHLAFQFFNSSYFQRLYIRLKVLLGFY